MLACFPNAVIVAIKRRNGTGSAECVREPADTEPKTTLSCKQATCGKHGRISSGKNGFAPQLAPGACRKGNINQELWIRKVHQFTKTERRGKYLLKASAVIRCRSRIRRKAGLEDSRLYGLKPADGYIVVLFS